MRRRRRRIWTLVGILLLICVIRLRCVMRRWRVRLNGLGLLVSILGSCRRRALLMVCRIRLLGLVVIRLSCVLLVLLMIVRLIVVLGRIRNLLVVRLRFLCLIFGLGLRFEVVC